MVPSHLQAASDAIAKACKEYFCVFFFIYSQVARVLSNSPSARNDKGSLDKLS